MLQPRRKVGPLPPLAARRLRVSAINFNIHIDTPLRARYEAETSEEEDEEESDEEVEDSSAEEEGAGESPLRRTPLGSIGNLYEWSLSRALEA